MKDKAIHRLFKYLEEKSIPHTRFEKEIGISNGYLNTQLKRNADIGETVLVKIINNCLYINPIWLLTGHGEMLKNETSGTSPEKPSLESLQCKIKLLKRTITDKDHIIALLTARIKELENKQKPSS